MSWFKNYCSKCKKPIEGNKWVEVYTKETIMDLKTNKSKEEYHEPKKLCLGCSEKQNVEKVMNMTQSRRAEDKYTEEIHLLDIKMVRSKGEDYRFLFTVNPLINKKILLDAVNGIKQTIKAQK